MASAHRVQVDVILHEANSSIHLEVSSYSLDEAIRYLFLILSNPSSIKFYLIYGDSIFVPGTTVVMS